MDEPVMDKAYRALIRKYELALEEEREKTMLEKQKLKENKLYMFRLERANKELELKLANCEKEHAADVFGSSSTNGDGNLRMDAAHLGADTIAHKTTTTMPTEKSSDGVIDEPSQPEDHIATVPTSAKVDDLGGSTLSAQNKSMEEESTEVDSDEPNHLAEDDIATVSTPTKVRTKTPAKYNSAKAQSTRHSQRIRAGLLITPEKGKSVPSRSSKRKRQPDLNIETPNAKRSTPKLNLNDSETISPDMCHVAITPPDIGNQTSPTERLIEAPEAENVPMLGSLLARKIESISMRPLGKKEKIQLKTELEQDEAKVKDRPDRKGKNICLEILRIAKMEKSTH